MPISLVRKLEQFTSLSDAEKALVQSLPMQKRQVAARHDVVSYKDLPTDVSLITAGFACRYKLVEDGSRQILSFLIPGDICDLGALLTRSMDHSVATLNACQIAVIPHHRLLEIIEKYPRLTCALWADTLHDAAIYRERVTNIGRRSAYARIAHLLCEVWWRLNTVGLTNGGSYELPATQADIADAMGLSLVHVNRTLQQLRAEGLISFYSKVVEVLDWERLRIAGEFDPAYLQEGPRPDRSDNKHDSNAPRGVALAS